MELRITIPSPVLFGTLTVTLDFRANQNLEQFPEPLGLYMHPIYVTAMLQQIVLYMVD